MAQPVPQVEEGASLLPSEVWVLVFSFLSTAEKNNIRASCKYFRDLVDHPSLWTHFLVSLSPKSPTGDPQFWATLKHRNVSRVFVRNWRGHGIVEQVVRSLPNLTTFVIEWSRADELASLKHLTNLKQLTLRCFLPLLPLRRCLPPLSHLTHLSLCGINVLDVEMTDFVQSISALTNLTSLLFHSAYLGTEELPAETFRATLSSLPKLKHLSWQIPGDPIHLHDYLPFDLASPEPQRSGLALCSLEMIECSDHISLSERALIGLSSLTSLTVHHYTSFVDLTSDQCHLKAWLTAPRQLTALHIHYGPPLSFYVDSVPATVTSLTLRMFLEEKDLLTLARRVPGLRHLHLDPQGTDVSFRRLPQLFPQLRSLIIRHQNGPDSDFLGLNQLKHLQRLVTNCHVTLRDDEPSPHLQDLISQLQTLSDHRIHITTSSHRDPLSCDCVWSREIK